MMRSASCRGSVAPRRAWRARLTAASGVISYSSPPLSVICAQGGEWRRTLADGAEVGGAELVGARDVGLPAREGVDVERCVSSEAGDSGGEGWAEGQFPAAGSPAGEGVHCGDVWSGLMLRVRHDASGEAEAVKLIVIACWTRRCD